MHAVTTKGINELLESIEYVTRFAKVRTAISKLEQSVARLEKNQAKDEPETKNLLWPSLSNRKE